MIINIPIISKEINKGKVKVVEKELKADLITSLAAELRFEKFFPKMAEREDLYSYTKRICDIEETSIAKTLSELKTLYCWLDVDIAFIDFVNLFDISNSTYMKKLTKSLKEVFDIVFESSAEKN